MEHDHASRAEMSGKLSQHRSRLSLEHQEVAAYHRVEGPLECHLCWVALQELDVAPRFVFRSSLRSCNGSRSFVGSDHFARISDEVRRQESDMASAGTNVQYAHGRTNSGVLEKSPRERPDETLLRVQTRALLI